MDQGEMTRRRSHEAALRAVHKPPAKPWRRGSGNIAAPAPKVYRVDPRGFRELVQRLTGAGTAEPATMLQGAMPPQVSEEQLYASSWYSGPLLSPASMACMDGHHATGGLL